MEWRDQGVLLAVRRHGESAAIIEVFTDLRGRHAGVVRGGGSRKQAPILQKGAQLDVTWRARLDEHIGTFRAELLLSRAATAMADRQALAGLNAICDLLKFVLPEREPHPRLYRATQALLAALDAAPDFVPLYLEWELLLLEDLGFGLDLGSCAVTGETEMLEFVSPRTGRAVSRAGAGEWAEKLLPYPAARVPGGVLAGLRTTGYFLETRLAQSLGDRPLPEARARLMAEVRRSKRDET